MAIAKLKQTPHTFPTFTADILTGNCRNRQGVFNEALLVSES